MSLQLYFAPGACSFVPHVLLEAAGAAFEPKLVKIHKGEQYSEEYKALNPKSQVPVLVTEGAVITQIVAITTFIAESFPAAKFLPSDPLQKARVLQTLAWMNNTVHPTFTHIFMPQKFTPDAAAQATIKAHNVQLFAEQLREINSLVAQAKATGGSYAAAAYGHDHLTALDAYVLTFNRWGSIAGIDPTQFTHSWAHIQTLAAHPAIAKVIERERLQLNLMG
ncbi:glutathione S-transferase family protein [Variovorax sp. PCZ-1]|uniref:glutathione S-transferase family protein n=1 Tax=Variovorax sp. PCZ-1 TaxID=2835533 RepID=UPI001BCDF6B3|nr:glutathione S-transferase family protein [Variovorax sp. PCZ-1]MBS7806036.1 glutathione S-transferase family protein [Variovorax sp. PCZ-1]